MLRKLAIHLWMFLVISADTRRFPWRKGGVRVASGVEKISRFSFDNSLKYVICFTGFFCISMSCFKFEITSFES